MWQGTIFGLVVLGVCCEGEADNHHARPLLSISHTSFADLATSNLVAFGTRWRSDFLPAAALHLLRRATLGNLRWAFLLSLGQLRERWYRCAREQRGLRDQGRIGRHAHRDRI